MKSIYEEIAQLYLRLNGFFISPNYVVEGEGSGEIDLLAYRPCGAEEYVEEYGTLPVDEMLFTEIEKILKRNAEESKINNIKETCDIAAIVEIKGKKEPWPENEKERRERIIHYSLKLFGVYVDENQAKELLEKGILYLNTRQRCLIIILMGFRLCDESEVKYENRYLKICIKNVLDFIIQRIYELRKTKSRNRGHYPYTSFKLLILLEEMYNMNNKQHHRQNNEQRKLNTRTKNLLADWT